MARVPSRVPSTNTSRSKRNTSGSKVKSVGHSYNVKTKRGKEASFKTKLVTNVKGESFKILPTEQYEYKRLLDNYNKAIKSFKKNINNIYTSKSNGMLEPETYSEVYGSKNVGVETRKLDYSMFTTKKQFEKELKKLKSIDKMGAKDYLLKRMSKNKTVESRMHDVFGQSAEAELATALVQTMTPEEQYYALENHNIFSKLTYISPTGEGDEEEEALAKDKRQAQLSNIHSFVRNRLEQGMVYGELAEVEDYEEATAIAKERVDKIINNSIKVFKQKRKKLGYKNITKKDMKKILGE